MPGGVLHGALHVYEPSKRLTVLLCGPVAPVAVLFVPGLTDGFMGTPYEPSLADAVVAGGASFVHPLLSSSYGGYGTASLALDTEELVCLLRFIGGLGVQRVVFVGHSTGCQNGLHLMAHGDPAAVASMAALVLQAPVSDAEYAATLPETEELVDVARGLEPGALMPVDASDAPITVYRFLSLSTVGGDDDMFSADTPAERIAEVTTGLALPVTLVYSGADEYVPAGAHALLPGRGEALLASMAPCDGLRRVEVIEGADHGLGGDAHGAAFVKLVMDHVREVQAGLEAEASGV